jgi:hypothetical protein
MRKKSSPLDNLRVAAPCSADWGQMFGDERVRFCAQCEKNVFNISKMTKREAERLIAQTEGRLCVRFYRRKDGTILTDNCPVGLRAIRRRVSRVATAMLTAVFGFLTGLGIYMGFGGSQDAVETGVIASPRIMGALMAPADNPYDDVRISDQFPAVVGKMAVEPSHNRHKRERRASN